MIKVKDMEEFKKNAQRLIAHLDEGENFFVIKQKEPDLIEWYESYRPLTYCIEREAKNLLYEIYQKRHQISKKETAMRLSEIKSSKNKNAKDLGNKESKIEDIKP